MRRFSLVLVAAAVLALSSPAWAAYTIYTKSGTRIVAREKYRVDGGKAIIIQQNGTAISYPLSEIDIPRTDEANRKELGSAVEMSDPKRDEATATKEPEKPSGSLTDLIERRGSTQARLPAASPPPTRKPETAPAPASVNAGQVRRQPFARTDVAAEILQLLSGTDVVGIFQGRSSRPLVEIKVAGESDAFLALTTTANAVVALEQKFPAQVPAVELYLRTAGGERAGSFTLTPDLVAQLVGKRQTAASFFVENVEF